MKLVSYLENGKEQLGIYHDSKIYNLQRNALIFSNTMLPDNMSEFLKLGEKGMALAKKLDSEIRNQKSEIPASPAGRRNTFVHTEEPENNLLAPVPHPTSCRDGYAFRQHV